MHVYILHWEMILGLLFGLGSFIFLLTPMLLDMILWYKEHYSFIVILHRCSYSSDIYTHISNFAVICYLLGNVYLSHIIQGYVAGDGADMGLFQWQWSNPERYT